MRDIINNYETVFEDNDGKFRMFIQEDILFTYVENESYELNGKSKNILSFIEDEHKKINKMLIQVRNGNLLPTEDYIWDQLIKTDFLLKSTIEKMAYVSENNVLTKMELERILFTHTMKIRVYRSLDEAIHWLNNE